MWTEYKLTKENTMGRQGGLQMATQRKQNGNIEKADAALVACEVVMAMIAWQFCTR